MLVKGATDRFVDSELRDASHEHRFLMPAAAKKENENVKTVKLIEGKRLSQLWSHTLGSSYTTGSDFRATASGKH